MKDSTRPQLINKKFFVSGAQSALHGAPNMDTLVAMGSGVSFAWSVCMLFAMTHAVVDGDAAAVALIKDSVEVETPIEQARIGDVFAVRPGESIPVDIVALDKTGTITRGEPSVTRLVPAAGVSEGELLQYAASLEAKSEHPLAKAVLREAEARARPDKDDYCELAKLGAAAAPYYVPKGLDGEPKVFLKAKPKTSEDCIACGVCAAVCPMGAKYFDDPAFLSHKAMLERDFQRRAETKWFV